MDPLTKVIKQLAKLPGIGERTAMRLAFHIMKAPPEYSKQLAEALVDLRTKLVECSQCCMLTESDPCRLCQDARRKEDELLVVASPQDVLAIERGGGYHGYFHVLHGMLSPLDGIGPEDIRVKELIHRLGKGCFKEVILATSPSVEGDATAIYLAKLIQPLGIDVSRIASGVPIGGDLEYADSVTLSRAIEGRRAIES